MNFAQGFRGPIRPVSRSPLYKFGVGLVAFAMILLPLFYFGLVGLVAYGVYWHAIHNTGILSASSKGRGSTSALALYLLPFVVGVILILFMIKPLFAPRGSRQKPISLDPALQPRLFEMIGALCRTVDAPPPMRIDVDCEANASACFRRGLASFLGSDLVLTIGLPLVAGMNLRQLVGILAHEFGHFSQGGAMRLSYIIRVINLWFARLVYERDSWDAFLQAKSRSWDIRIGLFLYAARLCIWLTRRILWALMMLGHSISTFMQRQMELDADRYEANVAGSATFASSSKQLALLVLARQAALGQLAESLEEGRLADDLPGLVVAQLPRIPAEIQNRFLEERLKGKGGVFDTHPPDERRLREAAKLEAPGIFEVEVPAREAFADFGGLCRTATAAYYREALEERAARVDLVSTSAVLDRQAVILEDQEALDRYFPGHRNARTPVFVGNEAALAPEDMPAAVAELGKIRGEMAAGLSRAQGALQSIEAADERLAALAKAEALLDANLKVDPRELGLARADKAGVRAERDEMMGRRGEFAKELEVSNALAARRLTLALRLCQVPDIMEKAGDPDAGGEQVARLLGALSSLRSVYEDVLELGDSLVVAGGLFARIEGNEKNQALVTKIKAAGVKWRRLLSKIQDGLAGAPYPFEHSGGSLDMARFAVERVAGSDELGDLAQQAQTACERILGVYQRILGRLVARALKAEAAAGPPP